MTKNFVCALFHVSFGSISSTKNSILSHTESLRAPPHFFAYRNWSKTIIIFINCEKQNQYWNYFWFRDNKAWGKTESGKEYYASQKFIIIIIFIFYQDWNYFPILIKFSSLSKNYPSKHKSTKRIICKIKIKLSWPSRTNTWLSNRIGSCLDL